MTGNRRLFTSYKAYDGGYVVFGSNLKGKVVGGGNITHDSITITNVEHVSGLAFNLISVGHQCNINNMTRKEEPTTLPLTRKEMSLAITCSLAIILANDSTSKAFAEPVDDPAFAFLFAWSLLMGRGQQTSSTSSSSSPTVGSIDNNIGRRLFCSVASSSRPFGFFGSASSSGSGLGSLLFLQRRTAPHETTPKIEGSTYRMVGLGKLIGCAKLIRCGLWVADGVFRRSNVLSVVRGEPRIVLCC
nr:integrase, catalytic region, zinc finger, CCHC-type, peptidase aspartic, catalytic [Tanacetum cinerariifolium]